MPLYTKSFSLVILADTCEVITGRLIKFQVFETIHENGFTIPNKS